MTRRGITSASTTRRLICSFGPKCQTCVSSHRSTGPDQGRPATSAGRSSRGAGEFRAVQARRVVESSRETSGPRGFICSRLFQECAKPCAAPVILRMSPDGLRGRERRRRGLPREIFPEFRAFFPARELFPVATRTAILPGSSIGPPHACARLGLGIPLSSRRRRGRWLGRSRLALTFFPGQTEESQGQVVGSSAGISLGKVLARWHLRLLARRSVGNLSRLRTLHAAHGRVDRQVCPPGS